MVNQPWWRRGQPQQKKKPTRIDNTATATISSSSMMTEEQDLHHDPALIIESKVPVVVRGGATGGSLGSGSMKYNNNRFTRNMETIAGLVVPPIVLVGRSVISFYRTLPRDAIIAQAGLLYCFSGGYYPTLFASIQAARQCGWEIAVKALDDLAEEANVAIDVAFTTMDASNEQQQQPLNTRELITQKTLIVLKTVDPIKINEAVGALYTTWLGIESVLSKQFASTISMALTLGDYMFPVVNVAVGTPLRLCLDEDYHRWVPLLVGWATKAAAMSVAWRIQRVLSASTSAVAGGFIFSRAIVRMLHKRGIRLLGFIRENHEETIADEILGITVAGLGLYSQLGHGVKTGFSFQVPYPLNLLTWPFDCAERWIQWQITKEGTTTTTALVQPSPGKLAV